MPAEDKHVEPAAFPRRLRRPTRTASFGSGRRESHDASDFYGRFVEPVISNDDVVVAPVAVDEIFVGDARELLATNSRVADSSVALMVTSPPYFAGKEYEEAMGTGHVPGSYMEYLAMLRDVFAACVQKLEPGGRMAVNVANLGRKPYRSLAADVITILQDDLQLLLRGEIVWQKALGAGGSVAWGSFQSAANPVLRDVSERVIVASKGRFDRAVDRDRRRRTNMPHAVSIGVDRFMESTTDVWEIAPESATRVGHPAPFPLELPVALIDLYTYVGDLVLDPFMGSGTTAVAARQSGRHYVGFDTDQTYVEGARARIAQADAARSPKGRIVTEVRVPQLGAEADAAPSVRAGQRGKRVKEVVALLLEEVGFVAVERNVKMPGGAVIDFVATDSRGARWHIDVTDAFTSIRTGLRRTDAVWKAIGKAALIPSTGRRRPRYVLLSTDAPPRNGASFKALVRANQTGIVHAALSLAHDGTVGRLKQMAAGRTAADDDAVFPRV